MKNRIKKLLKESLELKNISDSEEYWDRVKIIVKHNGIEVGYAILDMYMDDSEWDLIDNGDEGKYSDEEIEKHLPDGFAAKLEHLIIEPKYRNKGFANELMIGVLKYLKERNYKTLYLIASPMGLGNKLDLNNLTNFYKKHGLEVIKDFGNARDMIKQLK